MECERGVRHKTKAALMEKQVAKNEAGAFQGQAGAGEAAGGLAGSDTAPALTQHKGLFFSKRSNDSQRRTNNRQQICLEQG